ncbi:MAG: adenosylmethionine decarboxylase [Polyangiaceae bacterium]|nr:adenosylmethionine decarboxylase [Polyangiaceae bacterium]
MDTLGRHLLLELRGCDGAVLDDQARVERLLRAAAEAAGATVVQSAFHRFSPQGVTGVVVLEESHFSVHTWPETGYAAADFFTCGECHPERAVELLSEGLRAESVEVLSLDRGVARGDHSIVERYHRVERER